VRLRRRERTNLLLVSLPPVAALAGLWMLDDLPIELAAAGSIVAAIVALGASSVGIEVERAATLLDRGLGAEDAFLTLATCERREPQPLRPLVELDASSHAAGAQANRFLPPIDRQRDARSLLFSALGFLFVAMVPAGLEVPSDARLERIARELGASQDTEDQKLARELAAIVSALRDRAMSKEEKQRRVTELLAKLKDSDRGSGGASGGKAGSKEGKARGGTGGGEKGSGAGTGRGGEQALREQAGQELGKISGSLSETAEGGKSENQGEQGKSAGQRKPSEGGGLKGPGDKEGASERRDQQGGNQPGADQAKSGQKPDGNAEGEGRRNEPSGNESAGDKSPNPSAESQSGSAGKKPLPDSNSPPAERFYKTGEGPEGWRVENGRYVRVRVPEESEPKGGTEIVQKPGDARPQTPYGNAPLPSAGAPGEVRESQPLPLEYRDVLQPQS
jgi:hypothetical protein